MGLKLGKPQACPVVRHINGVEHHMKSDISKENQKKSMREKYGVDHPYQSPEIMAKMRAKNKEKYGVENVASLPEVQIKMAETRLKKYGVEHYNQLPEMRKYLREHCTEWLAESYKNPWAKGITRPEEWNQKQSITVSNLIEKGIWKGGSKTHRGKYKSKKCIRKQPMFRSGYELQVHFYLDKNENVDCYDYEPFQIPYYDTEGKLRHYTVDFIIKFKSGSILLIEVKNNYSKPQFLTHPKYKVLAELCEEYLIDYEIWANDDIKSLNLDIKQLLIDDRVTLFNLTD